MASSRPTVETKPSRAQKRWPTKSRFRSPFTLPKGIPRLPLIHPATRARAYVSGIEITVGTSSALDIHQHGDSDLRLHCTFVSPVESLDADLLIDPSVDQLYLP